MKSNWSKNYSVNAIQKSNFNQPLTTISYVAWYNHSYWKKLKSNFKWFFLFVRWCDLNELLHKYTFNQAPSKLLKWIKSSGITSNGHRLSLTKLRRQCRIGLSCYLLLSMFSVEISVCRSGYVNTILWHSAGLRWKYIVHNVLIEFIDIQQSKLLQINFRCRFTFPLWIFRSLQIFCWIFVTQDWIQFLLFVAKQLVFSMLLSFTIQIPNPHAISYNKWKNV